MYLELPEDSVTYLVYRGTHWHLVRILWLAGIWLHKCQRIYLHPEGWCPVHLLCAESRWSLPSHTAVIGGGLFI